MDIHRKIKNKIENCLVNKNIMNEIDFNQKISNICLEIQKHPCMMVFFNQTALEISYIDGEVFITKIM